VGTLANQFRCTCSVVINVSVQVHMIRLIKKHIIGTLLVLIGN
jgi:hypothetical protein